MTVLFDDTGDVDLEADEELFGNDYEDWGDAWDEDDEGPDDDPYPALRAALAPEYRYLPPEAIESIFGSIGLSAEDLEFDFGRALRSAGQAAAGLAPTVLPIAGTALGTVFGGPVGGALGGTLGQLAGGAIGTAAGPRPRPRGPRPVPSVAGLRPGAAGLTAPPRAPGGSTAAATLLRLLSQPEVLRALQGMALGSLGSRSVPVGGTPVPNGAFANLVGSLATRATAEHHAVAAGEDEGVPAYLLDGTGEPVVDVTLPEERAGRLLELLDAADRYEQLARGWVDDDGAWDLFEMVEDDE